MKFFSKMTALTVMGIMMIWGTQGMGGERVIDVTFSPKLCNISTGVDSVILSPVSTSSDWVYQSTTMEVSGTGFQHGTAGDKAVGLSGKVGYGDARGTFRYKNEKNKKSKYHKFASKFKAYEHYIDEAKYYVRKWKTFKPNGLPHIDYIESLTIAVKVIFNSPASKDKKSVHPFFLPHPKKGSIVRFKVNSRKKKNYTKISKKKKLQVYSGSVVSKWGNEPKVTLPIKKSSVRL